MADMEMSAKEESRPKKPENTEEGNIRDGDIWVNLNEIGNNSQSKLLQTTKIQKKTFKVLRMIMNTS